ncbi:antitoxin Xre/MbcA/ParS toxin-binding domain-containing protein [Microvirga massiliensis]|uniref:antitoxin Xre/MbcA/ParS toxin-binding domain-containing protein n=1 Tax=Microvirga massiliensis TaxID=1033741 RepID=UPI00062B576A|nr:antitoxin Xre/MbcA/ParS toxin-binding domain-containing protein [Microvirga massiliensis]
MTQRTDEIRALIEGLYDDPEDFLKAPHQWFGGRPPGEFLATEEGQLELLRFLRSGAQPPPNEIDRNFKPYTDADLQFIPEGATQADRLVEQAIVHLEGKIAQLRALKGSGPQIAAVIARTEQVFGELGAIWLVEHNPVLQATPLDVISRGKTDRVLTLLGRIESGVYA